MLPPVEKLQSAMKDNAAGHDASYYRRTGCPKEGFGALGRSDHDYPAFSK